MLKKTSSILLLFFIFTTISFARDKEEILTLHEHKKNILILSEHLEKCTPYKGEFIHPFNGQKMQREVTGIIEEKCVYIEEMPNNGKMTCRYDTEQLPVIAQYYRDLALAESYSTSAKITIQGDQQEVKTTYTINNKEVDNPLQECMQNGTCVISGYE